MQSRFIDGINGFIVQAGGIESSFPAMSFVGFASIYFLLIVQYCCSGVASSKGTVLKY